MSSPSLFWNGHMLEMSLDSSIKSISDLSHNYRSIETSSGNTIVGPRTAGFLSRCSLTLCIQTRFCLKKFFSFLGILYVALFCLFSRIA